MRRTFHQSRGASNVEYIIIVSLIAISCLLAVRLFGDQLRTLWSEIVAMVSPSSNGKVESLSQLDMLPSGSRSRDGSAPASNVPQETYYSPSPNAQAGDIAVKGGRGLLGPPVTGGLADDIPHVGLIMDQDKYGFSALDLRVSKIAGKDYGVIGSTTWEDISRFKNPGYFSLWDSNIPIKYDGQITTFAGLPDSVKSQLRSSVQKYASEDLGKNVGPYSVVSPGKSSQCFDWLLQKCDKAIKEAGIEVYRYEGTAAFTDWGRDKQLDLTNEALVPGTIRDWFSVGEGVATVLHGDRTQTWTDPSLLNDKLPRKLAPDGTGEESGNLLEDLNKVSEVLGNVNEMTDLFGELGEVLEGASGAAGKMSKPLKEVGELSDVLGPAGDTLDLITSAMETVNVFTGADENAADPTDSELVRAIHKGTQVVDTVEKASNVAQDISEALQVAGKAGKVIGSAAVILDVITAGFDAIDVATASNENEFADSVNALVRNVVTSTAGAIGAKGGAIAGAAVGGCFAGVGALIGAPLGAIAGGYGASWAAGEAYDKWLAETVMEYSKQYYREDIKTGALVDKMAGGSGSAGTGTVGTDPAIQDIGESMSAFGDSVT